MNANSLQGSLTFYGRRGVGESQPPILSWLFSYNAKNARNVIDGRFKIRIFTSSRQWKDFDQLTSSIKRSAMSGVK